jgi:Na+/proline symporter
MLLQQQGITLPTASDQLVTTAIESGFFSPVAVLLFTLGIVAATCSSSDSALISITTAINIDFLPPSDAKTSEKRRKITHACVCLGFILLLWGFYYMGNQNLLDTLFNIASYTYGPLLGIFAFGLFTRYQIHDKWVPIIALIAPICCLLLQWITHNALGYELLLLNGFITFVGLLVIKKS